jgi:hypothetical protein
MIMGRESPLQGLVQGTPEYTAAAAAQNQQYAGGDIQAQLHGQQYAYEKAMMQAKRGWAQEDQGMVMSLLDKYGAGGGGGGGPRVTGGDESWDAAMAAQMGKAKDTAAQAVGAARTALKGNMTARGIGGSGIEAKNERAIQMKGAGEIGAAGRDIAIQTVNRKANVNDRNYAGDITQRGQDIAAQGQKFAALSPLFSLLRSAAY